MGAVYYLALVFVLSARAQQRVPASDPVHTCFPHIYKGFNRREVSHIFFCAQSRLVRNYVMLYKFGRTCKKCHESRRETNNKLPAICAFVFLYFFPSGRLFVFVRLSVTWGAGLQATAWKVAWSQTGHAQQCDSESRSLPAGEIC